VALYKLYQKSGLQLWIGLLQHGLQRPALLAQMVPLAFNKRKLVYLIVLNGFVILYDFN
jgi:hypothetical protein